MTVGRIPSVEGGIQPTLLTAKGDLISATAASTVAVLPVGSDTQILVADSAEATGLKWATFAPTLNNDSTGNYKNRAWGFNNTTAFNAVDGSDTAIGAITSGTGGLMGKNANNSSSSVNAPMGTLWIYNYASATKLKQYQGLGGWYDGTSTNQTQIVVNGVYNSTTAITQLDVVRLSGTATLTNDSNTTVRLYGVI
jgi:hypothetical protein